MGAPGDPKAVDLAGVRSTQQLMDVFGEAFALGGPNGNVHVQSPTDGKGWGRNWNALLDSLTCLDTGGIWGTSRKLRFPLQLELKNLATYRAADPGGFATLMEVLEDARERYAENDLEFTYRVDHDA
jgi:RNAse (barnase) inhibitor barstar